MPMRQSVIAYIGLGANLGDAQLAVLAAMDAIADLDGVALLRRSSLYGSAPVDAGGADYVNAVVEIQTRLKALELLPTFYESVQKKRFFCPDGAHAFIRNRLLYATGADTHNYPVPGTCAVIGDQEVGNQETPTSSSTQVA
jgi:hypothetical protein